MPHNQHSNYKKNIFCVIFRLSQRCLNKLEKSIAFLNVAVLSSVHAPHLITISAISLLYQYAIMMVT